MTSQLTWYLARSSGLVAWAILSASVIWGLTLSSKATWFGKRPRPSWVLDLHRYLGGLATIFVAVHVGALVADSYVDFGPSEVLVPFASAWRPGAVAWGVVGMYLLLAVELTSLARKHLPKKVWRAVHVSSLPLFAFSTIHAFTAGTDTSSLLFVGVATVVTVAIGGGTAYRIAQSTNPPPKPVRVPVVPVVPVAAAFAPSAAVAAPESAWAPTYAPPPQAPAAPVWPQAPAADPVGRPLAPDGRRRPLVAQRLQA